MRPVELEERVDALKRFRISPPVIRLATGKIKHAFFRDYREPWKTYRGIAWKNDPLFVPLWEKYDTITAVREKGKGLEFFAIHIESVRQPRVLARSEQGLLATLFFNPLNSYYDDPADYGKGHLRTLKAAAKSIGFSHFENADTVFRELYAKGFDAFEAAYRRLIRDIDAGRLDEEE